MKSSTYAVLIFALLWTPSVFSQGNVTQIQKGRNSGNDQQSQVVQEPEMEKLKNDGSIEDLYRSRRNTMKSVSQVQRMLSLPGSDAYVASGGDLGDTSDLYVTNEACPQVTQSAVYPRMCRLFKNSYFAAGANIVFRSDKWFLLLIIEIVFLVFISIIRAGKRKKVTELFSVGSILKEVRFTLFSTVVAIAVIPIAVFGKGYISLILGLIQA